jgi:hypothetical protein
MQEGFKLDTLAGDCHCGRFLCQVFSRFPVLMTRCLYCGNVALETGNAAESDAFVRLQGQPRSGTLVEGDDEVSLNGEREKTIRRALRKADAMFATCAACSEEVIKLSSSRPDLM